MKRGFLRICGKVSSARSRGMSLVEMSVVLAISGALAATSVPTLNGVLQKQQLGATTNELISAMQLARSEAITRGARVVVAAKTPGRWADGWRVFVDADDNGRLDDGEPTLREFGPATGVNISTAFGATYRGDFFSFNALGVARKPGGDGLVMGHLKLTNDAGVRTLCFAKLRMRTVEGDRCPRA
jgi:type IV fimbrial biogenesis protein FimT